MWRGPTVEARKNQANAAKGKVYAIHAKLIELAAQRWADPSQNIVLSEAIAKAKKANVPVDVIERAVKRGSGQDKDAAQILEVTYEWYASGWVGIIVKTLTDNKNRTASNIRHHFSKSGGSLAETGSVSGYNFKFAGVIYLKLNGKTIEDLEEVIIESGAEDYTADGDEFVKVIADRTVLSSVVKYFREKWLEIEQYALEYLPNNKVSITDFDKALKILTLIGDLEDDDDVEDVWNNADIWEDLERQVEEMIEKSRFRT
jgi:YebC/PmpR family DNA-binding regulatory protein